MRGVLVLWVILSITWSFCTRYFAEASSSQPSRIAQGLPNVIPSFDSNVQQRQIFPVPTPLTSYGPPAAGASTVPSNAPQIKPLPPLLPSSVLKQLMKALPSTSLTVPTPPTNELNALPPIPGFDPPKEEQYPLLTSFSTISNEPDRNASIYAAGILSSILRHHTSAETTLHEIDPSTVDESSLNKTDLIIVKTEKRAYIIPMQSGKQPSLESLYNNRESLQRTYTVNQFLFIIMPKNVNFLNKLV